MIENQANGEPLEPTRPEVMEFDAVGNSQSSVFFVAMLNLVQSLLWG